MIAGFDTIICKACQPIVSARRTRYEPISTEPIARGEIAGKLDSQRPCTAPERWEEEHEHEHAPYVTRVDVQLGGTVTAREARAHVDGMDSNGKG